MLTRHDESSSRCHPIVDSINRLHVTGFAGIFSIAMSSDNHPEDPSLDIHDSSPLSDTGSPPPRKDDKTIIEEQVEDVNQHSLDAAAAEKGYTDHDVTAVSDGTFRNLLSGIPRESLMANVKQFAQEKDLEEHVELLQTGALLAQNPQHFESLDIDESAKEILRKEITHKWHQPRALYYTIILCSIGACVQGWDQEGSNGANLSFPQEFGISNSATLPDGSVNPDYEKNNWLVGLVNSAPYISAAIVACWLSDPINYYIGRRGTIFLAAIFCLLSPIGSACTQSWPQLFVCRLLLGLGVGFKETTAPVFAAENSPANIRGALVMTWQLWTAFGILLGVCANLILYRVGTIAWRLQLGSAFIPAVPLILGVYFCPESPRWYMKRNRYKDAFRSLRTLRFSELQAARDLYYIHCLLIEEYEQIGNRTYIQRFLELFYVPRLRRATLASWVVMIGQQMCGINIISFFSSSIFFTATNNEKTSLLASFGFGLINWTFAWPAIWTIDTFGRRSLLLFTFPNMCWTLLAAGFSFYLPNGSKRQLGAVTLFIYLFTIFYSPGEGPVPFAYSAEVFPLSHREVGMSWAVATNNFYGAILSLTFFRIEAAFTIVGAFGFYAGLNAVATVMILLWVPETKQLTLEELDYVFSIPTRKHMSYQVKYSLPYYLKLLTFQKPVPPEPLYKFEEMIYRKA